MVFSISSPTLDDLLWDVLKEIQRSGKYIKSNKGDNIEILGAFLELRNPRARLSRSYTRGKIFGAVGELMWYLSGSNNLDQIAYYLPAYKHSSDDGKKVYGGYGPRLRSMPVTTQRHVKWSIDQIYSVIRLLKERPSTRQAVIQLFNAEDLIVPHKDIPCTCTMQFFVRDGKLNMATHMRSNDAFVGIPHDFFCFTMLQEIIAKSVGVDVGVYHHFVGSLHCYIRDEEKIDDYFKEGHQTTLKCMPEMPGRDLWENIDKVLQYESRLRASTEALSAPELDGYWSDVAVLLQFFKAIKDKGASDTLSRLVSKLKFDAFLPYLLDKEMQIDKEMQEKLNDE